MYICMYVCMYVFMYVVCVYVCVCVCIHTYHMYDIYIYIYIYIYILCSLANICHLLRSSSERGGVFGYACDQA